MHEQITIIEGIGWLAFIGGYSYICFMAGAIWGKNNGPTN